MKNQEEEKSRFEKIFGFPAEACINFEKLNMVLHREVPGYSLAVFRMCFGFILFVDLLEDRGFQHIIKLHGCEKQCKFPFYDIYDDSAISNGSVIKMFFYYVIMSIAAIFLSIGYFYRLSVIILAFFYFQMLRWDKANWSNHSFSYFILLFNMCFMNPHYVWSIDSRYWPNMRHPRLWNYAIIRIHIFTIIFFSGLKKYVTADWMNGYTLQGISANWVFDLLKFVLDDPTIEYYIVHQLGLLVDVFGGFLLYFDQTRIFIFPLLSFFYLLYTNIGGIGMYPLFVFVGTTTFFSFNWSIAVPIKINEFLKEKNVFLEQFFKIFGFDLGFNKPNTEVIIKSRKKGLKRSGKHPRIRERVKDNYGVYEDGSIEPGSNFKCWVIIIGVIIHYWLLFADFFVDMGSNTWTIGLHGNSWDSMYYTWEVAKFQINVDFKFKNQNRVEPKVLDLPENVRWIMHSDQLIQLSHCIEHRFSKLLGTSHHPEGDIIFIRPQFLVSLNGRFFQRVYAPVNLKGKDWSYYDDKPKWIVPLLSHDDNLKQKVKRIVNSTEEELIKSGVENPNLYYMDIVDFKGFELFIQLPSYVISATVQVIKGKIQIREIQDNTTLTILTKNDTAMILPQIFFITVKSKKPAVYVIIYEKNNSTKYPMRLSSKRFASSNENYKILIPLDAVFRVIDKLKNAFRNMFYIFVKACYTPKCFPL